MTKEIVLFIMLVIGGCYWLVKLTGDVYPYPWSLPTWRKLLQLVLFFMLPIGFFGLVWIGEQDKWALERKGIDCTIKSVQFSTYPNKAFIYFHVNGTNINTYFEYIRPHKLLGELVDNEILVSGTRAILHIKSPDEPARYGPTRIKKVVVLPNRFESPIEYIFPDFS